MLEFEEKDIQFICSQFQVKGTFLGCERIPQGKVNDTFIAHFEREDRKSKDYIVQRINTYAFTKPVELMQNADRITDHIHAKYPKKKVLHYHHTKSRNNLYVDADGGYWRLFNFIESQTLTASAGLGPIRSAGAMFGDFQMCLSDFDAASLYYTIPDFHDTRKRYESMIRHHAAASAEKQAEVASEYDALMANIDKACTLTDMYNRGELPLRVTHNDTKVDNVLFDKKNVDKAIAVIDLDTVMPGLVGHDFGDAIRSASNRVGSSCPDLEKVRVDMSVFEAFASGFIPAVAGCLTQAEKETLAISCYCIAMELAVRYLDDYLVGNRYFKYSYPTQNLVRCRNQMTLASDMLSKMDQMQSIIERYL